MCDNPGHGVPRQGVGPECHRVAVDQALRPGKASEQDQDGQGRGRGEQPTILHLRERSSGNYTYQGKQSNAGMILKVIADK